MEKLLWDLHTHTTYSHGKGSIEDNVKVAVKKGLKKIAISDHGPGHRGYGIKRAKIKEMRREIEELKPRYPEIEILLGVEANVINKSGALDVTKEEFGLFDLVLAGYHYGAFDESPVHDLGVHAKNLFFQGLHTTSPRQKRMNTDLMLKAVYENDILYITHPGAKYEIYMEEVAKACSERGIWMEVNNSHPFLTTEQIALCAGYDVTFVIGSDAHVPHKVGCCEMAVERFRDSGVDPKRIINLDIDSWF